MYKALGVDGRDYQVTKYTAGSQEYLFMKSQTKRPRPVFHISDTLCLPVSYKV
jgi:hypothetical protein